MERSKRTHWEERGISRSAPPPPPAQPVGEDIAGFEACAAELAGPLGRPTDALILGFTRGIVSMRWPARAALTAMDWSGAMYRRQWPRGSLPGNIAPLIGDWREMPFPATSFDLVIGDGSYASLDSFADCAVLNLEAWRVLRPGGLLVLRCFLRPCTAESVDRLFEELNSGRIPAFEQFRWRLAMALHPSGEGVVAAEIWRTWRRRVDEPGALCARLGWAASDAASIDAWKDQDVRVPMPTLAELDSLTAGRFELIGRRVPAYPLGQRFPILVLRRRP